MCELETTGPDKLRILFIYNFANREINPLLVQ